MTRNGLVGPDGPPRSSRIPVEKRMRTWWGFCGRTHIPVTWIWMTRRCITASVVVSMLVAVPALGGAQQIVVGPNIHVSHQQPQTWHRELWADADAANPDRLIVCGIGDANPYRLQKTV